MDEDQYDYDQAPAAVIPHFARDPLGVLRRRWRWMLAVFVLGVVATGAYVATLKPRYRASASLLIASQRIPEDFVRTTIPDDILQRVDGLVAQALTRERMAGLVDKFGLYEDKRDEETRAQTATRARNDLWVQLDPSMTSGRGETALIFSVSFAADDAETSAEVANEIVGLIQGEAVRLRTEQARLTTGFLRRELERNERELREQERLITEFKSRHRGALPDELDSNLAKLERLQQQRQSLALQIAEASTRVTMISTAGGIETPVTPDSRLLLLRAELAKERSAKTEAHPDVVSLVRQIERLESLIAASPPDPATGQPTGTPNALVAAEHRALAELRAQLAATEQEIRDLDRRVGETPARAEEFEALDQKAVVLRENYLEFLRKVQEAELSESLELAQQGQRVSILNPAAPPMRPETDRLTSLVFGLFASLAAAGAAGVLFELSDPVLVDLAHAEAETGLPGLGSVPIIG